MTYGSQAAAASQVFDQQRDLALRDRANQQLAQVDAAAGASRRRDLRPVRAMRSGDRDRNGSRPSPGRPTASTARAPSIEGSVERRVRTTGHATRWSASSHSAGGRDASRRHDPFAAGRVRAGRSATMAQGRVAPADRRVQAARRLRRGRLAARRGPGARRHHLLVGQPRPGRGSRGPAARRAGGHRHAIRRAADQAGAGRGGRRAGRGRRHRPATSGSASPRRSRRNDRSRSSRRSTTTGSSPARGRSASSSSRTSPTWRWSSCRSAAAGWRAAWRPRSRRSGHRVRVIGVEPELGGRRARLAGARRDRALAVGARVADDRRRRPGRRRWASARSRTCGPTWTGS